MFFSRDNFSDTRVLALLHAAAFEANGLIEQSRATVAESQRLLELIAKIECPKIAYPYTEQPNSKRADLFSPTDDVIE